MKKFDINIEIGDNLLILMSNIINKSNVSADIAMKGLLDNIINNVVIKIKEL